jgi:PAS domain S-box-containing protein
MQLVLVDADGNCEASLLQSLARSAFSFSSLETLSSLEGAERFLKASHPDLMFVDQATARQAGPDWFAGLRKLDKNLPIVSISARPDLAPAGSPHDFFDYIVLDDSEITDRALNFVLTAGENRQALRIAEEKLRLAESVAQIGTWEWHVETGMFVLSDNNLAMFGLTANEAGSYAEWFQAVHPDDMEAAATAFAQALAGADGFDLQIRVNRNHTRSGIDYRTLRSLGRVLRREDGSPYRIVGVHTDITGEVALVALSHRANSLEERLNAAEAQFQTLFDTSIDCLGFLVPDESGKLVYAAVNPAGMAFIHAPFDQVRGRAPIDLLPGVVGETLQANLQRCFEIGEISRCQPAFDIKGQSFTFDAVCSPVRGADGELIGVLGNMRDISDQRRTERMLRQAQKLEALGQLAGGVAHDFNNLLASTGACFRLLDKHVENDRGRMILTEGERTVARGRGLTERLLRFSRTGPATNELAEIDDCLRDVGDTLRHTLGYGIRITVATEAPGCRAAVDSREVELALINLAVNARDAMPDGGALKLESRCLDLGAGNVQQLEPGRYVMTSVTDDGAGMTPDILAHATDPFFTTKGEGVGTGLGLSIVAKFMHDHGGEVVLESEVGRGTRVSLYFPEVAAEDAVAEAAAEAA